LDKETKDILREHGKFVEKRQGEAKLYGVTCMVDGVRRGIAYNVLPDDPMYDLSALTEQGKINYLLEYNG
jgi:hypothetical protein